MEAVEIGKAFLTLAERCAKFGFKAQIGNFSISGGKIKNTSSPVDECKILDCFLMPPDDSSTLPENGIPHGKVLYDLKKNCFVIISTPGVISNKRRIKSIMLAFNIPQNFPVFLANRC
ncbi:MAG: hypothetical protein HQM08_26845 [Candidatus Riflebacteria bacterium]|nr:hypothetical protein [Candidatus Riflebacteria bacterium]